MNTIDKETARRIINERLDSLTDDQAQAVVEYVEYLASDKTIYEAAPQHVRDSIELGREDARAGRVVDLDDALASMKAKIDAHRPRPCENVDQSRHDRANARLLACQASDQLYLA